MMRPTTLAASLVLGWTVLFGTGAASAEPTAEVDRLQHELDRLIAKGAWRGVERTYGKLVGLQPEQPARVHVAGGDAARQRGDATLAQRRYLKAARLDPEAPDNNVLAQYRTGYGVLEVRRVEASCIRLTPAQAPFDPTHAAAIRHAGEALSEQGAFRGLVPVGDYTVGSNAVTVVPGMKPVVVQRAPGDSDCR